VTQTIPSGPAPLDPAALKALVRFLQTVGRLKSLRRQGWVDRGVAAAESVADHVFRLAVMAWVLGRARGLEPDRLVRLALVHDLAESLVGDLTPFDELLAQPGVDRRRLLDRPPPPEVRERQRQRKRAREEAAFRRLVADLPAAVRQDLESAWQEYLAGQTPAARFVKELDKVETWLQALEYRAIDPDLPIGSFAAEVQQEVSDPLLRALVQVLGASSAPGPEEAD